MFRSLLLCCALAVVAQARADQADPMGTASWDMRRAELFAGAPVAFDPRVVVLAPAVAENPLQVPVAVNVDPAIQASRILVFTDYNPILKVLAFEPGAARPYLAFRVKMQQSGPVRAAALGADGVWHVGHAWVVTTGGGCTLPALGRTDADWETRLNEVAGRVWNQAGADTRVRFRIVHPMDTGLAPGIPAFFLQRLDIADTRGRPLMAIEVFEPVSENPVFTLDLPTGQATPPLRLTGVDNNGNRVRAELR
jgi:sulfur-oxidizing protein SoxY